MTKNTNGTKTIYLTLIAIAVIIVRYSTSRPNYNRGDRIKITAIVRSEPVNYDNSQYLKLAGLKFYLPLYPGISYGDKVVVEGIVDGDKLSQPALKEIVATKAVIYKTRSKLLEVYKRSLPTNESALVAGVTIGSKSGISSEFWESLRRSGTAHVVVASGMNVTLVAGFLLAMCLSLVKRKNAILIVILGIWIYAVICGFDAPIVRAAIMGSIGFLAQLTGRLNQTIRAVIYSAFIMLFVVPDWIFDVGFILSFTATLSLVVFTKKVKDFVEKIKLINKLPELFKESLITTTSAQIGVIPVLYFTFGSYNPLSIAANVLTLWTIPIITIVGFIGGIFGMLYYPFGQAVLLLIYPLAKYFTGIVGFFG